MPMDEIVLAQNKYISSKRASRLTGYAQDYIGQLVRLGKVSATKVGKAWFVDEAGLMRHINGSSRLAGPVKELAEAETRSKANYASNVTAGITYPSTWKAITYMHDDSPLSPISDSRDNTILLHSVDNLDRDNLESEGVSVKINRSTSPARRFVVASTVDGVRFEAPKSELRLEHGPKVPFDLKISQSTEVTSDVLAYSRSYVATTRKYGFRNALRAALWTTAFVSAAFLVPFVV